MKNLFSIIGDRWWFRSFKDKLRQMRRPRPSVFEQKPWLAFYDQGVPPEISLPAKTLCDLLQEAVDLHPERTALIYFGRKISYARLNLLIEQFAQGLIEFGIRKGDCITLILPNLPQFIIAYWAALRCGALPVPMNPLCSVGEVQTMTRICRPKMIIAFEPLCRKLNGALDEGGAQLVMASIGTFMPPMTHLLYFFRNGMRRQSASVPMPARSFSSFFRSTTHSLPSISPQDQALLLFTGGVTGVPKAVLLHHHHLVANTLQTRVWLGADVGNPVIVGVLPLFHSYGMTACHHLAIAGAATLILEPRFKAARVLDLMQKYHPTLFAGVPTMFRALLNFITENNKRVRCSCICVSGGAPLPLDLKHEFEQATGARLIEGYGLTETSPITHCNPAVNRDRAGSIGLPFPNTEARIVDPKGRPTAVGEIGELQVRGPQVMSGYFCNPAETQLVLSADGWFSTGDLARMDADGFFYIVDRKKDLILYGGFNIYPSEVEEVLNEHPDIAESAVVGLPDSYYGEVVAAFIKLEDGAAVSPDRIVEFCRNKLAPYKVPKRIEFVDQLPKNFIGKIVRRKLLENFSNGSV